MSKKNILKNNSTLNSKEETNINNFIFIRKLDNFSNHNDTSNENKSDDILNNEETNKNITDDETNNDLNNMNMIDDELNNKETKKNEKNTKEEEDPATYFLSFYAIFFAMGVYRICQMKDIKGAENRTNDVSKNEKI